MKIKLLQVVGMLSKYAFIGLFLQTMTFTLLLAAETKVQENKSVKEVFIDLNVQNADIIKTFHSIEAQTDFKFNYEKKDLENSRSLTINVRRQSVANILMEISKEAKLKFRQVNNNINVNKLVENSAIEPKIEIIIDDIEITGRVTGKDDNEGLPGVNVIVKGTSNGTVTDIDGRYSLNAPEDGKLVFSSVGYISEEIVIGSQNVINLAMTIDITSLEEIVVIGYGSVEKKDVTGAIGTMASEDIVRANPAEAAKAIQGQVAGVNVTKANGKPGSGYNIVIRGLSSIDYSNEPLVVIDGVMGGDMNSLNPADIESMDILKDASSTAIYGSRGANGVIIISTKRGSKGKPMVSYNGYVGVKSPSHLPDMQTAQQFYQASVIDNELNGGTPRSFTSTEIANYESGKSVDWVDEVVEPSLQLQQNISVAGGNDNTNYYFSSGYLNEGGNLLNTKYQRYNINGSIDSEVNKYIKVGFTANYSYGKLQLGSNEALRSAYRARPTGVIMYDEILNPDENKDEDWNGYAVWMGINDKQVLNPLVEQDPENFRNETRSSAFIGNAYVEILPVKGLSIKSSISTQVFGDRLGDFRGTYTKSGKTSLPPTATRNTTDLSNYTWDNIITYQKEVGDNNFSLTGVQSSFYQRTETMNSQVKNLPYNSLWYAMGTSSTIDNLETNLIEQSLLSFMGRFMYGYKDKYLLTLTGRWDGASQLSDGNKWAFFPSAAAAWRLSDEEFIKNLNTVSNLKLRVSYGYVGNSAVSPYSTQATLIHTPYDFDGASAYGFAPQNLGDKSLQWEKSQEFDIGLDMGFFENRITASLDFYNRHTVDLIYKEQIPTSSGFGEVVTNIGEVQNKGVELSLNTVNIAKNSFTWTTNVNFSKNNNEVLSIGSDGILADISTGLFVGEPLGANYYYKFDGIWQSDEEALANEYKQVPGSVRVVDTNDDGKISSNADEDDRQILGSTQPKWLMGMTNKFTLGSFDLSFLIYTSQGAQYRNSMLSGTMGEVGTGRYNALNLNYWTVNNPTNDYYGPGVSNPYRQAIQYQDASFVRISDITFGYTLPGSALSRIGFSNFRMYAQVLNPFLFSDFDGMDPEYNSGTYDDDVSATTYLFGLSLSF